MRVALTFLSIAVAEDFSYYCLGATHGCVLSQHEVTPNSGFYDSLVECESQCPIFGKDLSWECAETGNCEISETPPNPKENKFATFEECSNAPGGKCFAPGTKYRSYECHGPHFGCVVKQDKPDGKSLFATFDECATACHRVPEKMSFGCAGTRPNSCVLVAHEADEKQHYYEGIEGCKAWCNEAPGSDIVV